MSFKIAVGILGGTGYGAGELLRLLVQHPSAEVVTVVSSSQAGQRIAAVHPQLEGFYSLELAAELDPALFSGSSRKVMFAALPHGASGSALAQLVPGLQDAGIKVIDLSGDFRLADPAVRRAFYPEAPQEPGLQQQFVYGLPEINRTKIAGAACVANPGCFASTCILAAAPLTRAGLGGYIAFDGKSGTSGAGRNPQPAFHHPQSHGNVNAYKILEHRHEPEIVQGLALGEPQLSVSFVPHVIPAARGIYATAHMLLDQELQTEELLAMYREFYAGSPFVRIRDSAPDLHMVVGSNFCDITVKSRGRQVTAVAALDNLVKGMCGVAIQNMNLLCGLPETTGLWVPALGPL